jgi:GT2 family glycosyltransferase
MTTVTSAPVAIAVVSWNTRGLLDDCLRSLQPESRSGRADVWVVDNGSSDGSADLVRERHPWATLIASERNLGFGAAVNLVAERTDHPWIAPVNADIRLRPGALQILLDTGSRLRRAGIVAPRLILDDGATQRSVYPFPTIAFTLLFNLGIASANDGRAGHPRSNAGDVRNGIVRVDWAIGAFLLIRRAAWDQAGGFDPEQWMYAEDLDLGWRISRTGWRTYYDPRAIVDHREAASTTQVWGETRQEQMMRSTYCWMLRRRGLVRTRVVACVNVFGASLRALALAPAVRLSPERWAWRQRWFQNWARLHRIGLAPRARLDGHR